MKRYRATLIAMLLATTSFAQGVTDVHSHIITSDFVSALKKEGKLSDEGFPLPRYDVESHLKWMDEAGVTTSVLTLAAPQPASADVVREANEAAARIKKEHPGRFMFCAALPLPDVDAAIREAKYALDTLKADGIKLATNVQGQYLGAPELDTLFAFLNERKAVVILHPHRPEPVNREVMTQTPLAMQEYLSETTRAVTNMISRNVLARYSEVKVVVPHCGAYLPLAMPRMRSLAPVMQANKLVGDIDWEANLRTLYYDLAGAHSPETIRQMLTITTPDHLLYGADFPYAAPHVLTQSLERMKQYLEEYLAIAREVDRLSIEREPGVVCLYPMQSSEDPCQIRILEIYASEEVYQQHLQTEHFQKYKTGTLHMVKSLKLPLMKPLDSETMKQIFIKQNMP